MVPWEARLLFLSKSSFFFSFFFLKLIYLVHLLPHHTASKYKQNSFYFQKINTRHKFNLPACLPDGEKNRAKSLTE